MVGAYGAGAGGATHSAPARVPENEFNAGFLKPVFRMLESSAMLERAEEAQAMAEDGG
jgi:hypothetical protein